MNVQNLKLLVTYMCWFYLISILFNSLCSCIEHSFTLLILTLCHINVSYSSYFTWLSTLIQHCITDIIDTLIYMETKNFGYSLKNIPIPTKSNYLKSMVEKVESFIRRLRWKAYFFCKDAKRYDNASVNSFGFKSLATPPQNEHLKAFEDTKW